MNWIDKGMFVAIDHPTRPGYYSAQIVPHAEGFDAHLYVNESLNLQQVGVFSDLDSAAQYLEPLIDMTEEDRLKLAKAWHIDSVSANKPGWIK